MTRTGKSSSVGKSNALVFPRERLREMLAHLQREYPREGCGFLAGRRGRVEKVIPVINAEGSVVAYTMDGKAQLQAFKAMDQRGLECLAVYHSHGFSPAVPSETDRARAFYPDVAYVIASLAGAGEPDVRAWSIRAGTVRERKVRVV